jgi:hypothetical protein
LSAVYSDAYLVELARSFEQLSAVHVMQQNWSEAQQLCVQALGAYTQVQSNSDQDFSQELFKLQLILSLCSPPK